MDPDPLMADYQLLGDGFGYHGGYGGQTNTLGGQAPGSGSGQPPGGPPPPNTSIMPGGQVYHQLPPGPPPHRYASGGDGKNGFPGQYPSFGSSGPPMTSLGGQYSSGLPDYPRPGLGQGHLGMGPSAAPGAGYPSRLMSPFGDQRAPPPGIGCRPPSHPTPIHPMSGPQSYPGYPSSSPAPGYGPTPNPSDPWPQQHLQQPRPPYSYSGAPPSVRPSFSGPGDQYSSSMHGRSFYPPTPGSQAPQSSSHLTGDSSLGLYSSQSPFAPSSPAVRGHSSSQRPQQPPPSSYPFTPSSLPGSTTGPAGPRFSQQYPYGQTPFPDSAQSRMSPYGLPPGVGPNSPGFRPSYAPSQMSPRRPTPTPPSGSPMPPTSRTPDRVVSATTVSVSQANYPSAGASQPLTSPAPVVSPSGPTNGPPPSNSLAQLEQMVGGNSLPHAPPNKTVVSSSSNFYGSVPSSGPPPNSQSVYSHFSAPSPVPSSQNNSYYSYQPPPSSTWPPPPTSLLGQSVAPTSVTNTLSSSGTAPSSSVPFSPGSQINQQNSSLRSPQTPSASNVKSPLNSQFSAYDNQFSSVSGDSFNSKTNDISQPGSLLPSMTSIQKSPFDSTSFDTSGQKTDSEQALDSKTDPNKEQESFGDTRSPGTSFYTTLRPSSRDPSGSSGDGKKADPNRRTPNAAQRNSTCETSYLTPSGSYQDLSQPPSYINQQMYPPHQQPQQQSSYSQQMTPFANSYNSESSLNYDMSGSMTDSINNYSGTSYNQNYSSGPTGMDSMMGSSTHGSLSEYAGQMQNDMSGNQYEASPYDEPFSSEPPTKKRGKGRPKKDPSEPKKEKKPRQPRTPKTPGRGRGRGRGAGANKGDRVPPAPEYELSPYGMPPEPPSDMYHMHGPPPGFSPHMSSMPPPDPFRTASVMPPHPGMDGIESHPGIPPVPGLPPPPQPPSLPIDSQNSMCPPHAPLAGHNQIGNNEALSSSIENNPFDNLGQSPVPVPGSSISSHAPQSITSINAPLPLPSAAQVNESLPHDIPPVLTAIPSQEGIPSDKVQVRAENETATTTTNDDIKSLTEEPSTAESVQSEDMFSQSTSSSQEQALFSIPPSEESSSVTLPPGTESSTDFPAVAASSDQTTALFACGVDDSMTTTDETPVSEKKGKKKGKKRKIKEDKEVPPETQTFDGPQTNKAKKPKRQGKKKGKKGDEATLGDTTVEGETSTLIDGATDIDTTLADISITSSSQDDGDGVVEGEGETSALDSSLNETGKGKKGKGKGTPKTPKKPKLKEGKSSAKKKLPKIALAKFKGKKKKRLGSDVESDMEKTPPPSPEQTDSGIQKRRSARVTKRTKYLDDVDLDLSGDDAKKDQPVVTVTVDDTMVVEKIMCTRMGTRELEPENEEEEAQFKKGKPPTVQVEEFYVKYKNLSYLHCDWRTEEELEKGDKRIGQKIKRFKMKKDNNTSFDFLEDEPFNPDYCEVDRILDVNIIEEVIPDDPEVKPDETKAEEKKEKANKMPDDVTTSVEKSEDAVDSKQKEEETEEKPKAEIDPEDEKEERSQESETNADIAPPQKEEQAESQASEDKPSQPQEVAPKKTKTRTVYHFLVKWQALPYEESTWELEDDLDPGKVKQFWRFREVPPKDKTRHKKRPKAQDWKKLDSSLIFKNGNTLREYQLEGLNWLTFCWYNGRNCILADEMGLGKTIQSLTFINEMVKYGIHSPYLVIAPLSTIGNWQREFETWTDLNVITYHGSSASRNMLQEYEMYYKNEKGERIEGIYKFQVMITTFEIVLTDCLELREIPWKACIIDEAHRLKNRNCKLLEGLRLLNMEHRVLLTGTPLQNNVEELFSLLNFLEPAQFSSPEAFLQEFGDLKTEEQVEKLQAILKPMMLRRLKEDVEKSLAPKEETIVEVELTNIQKKYYRAILERNFQFLSKGGTYANMPNLMNTMMELRKCCIHPFLINGAEEQIMEEYKQQHGHDHDSQMKCMIQAAGKLVLIDKLLPRLRADGHRVLIFSQMVRCLDILEDYVVQKKYPYERIDGRVRGNLRQAAIDRYSKPGSDRFVFLLCTRAGGLGINLTAADTVIIFDSDWNPQNDLQAQARCHRIGQSKAVKIYRLICRNTYEREMFDKASLKLGLDKAVLQSMNTQGKGGIGGDAPLSKKEVEELLRKGAYGAVMDDDNAGDKFCEEDIDQILTRRTQVIMIESGEKGSTFSKASFASSENADIEIDDPNFWEKWAKKANIDTEDFASRNELIVQEPRRRTQTKRFGQDDGMMEISDVDSSEDDDEGGVSGRTRGGRGRAGRGKKGKRGRGGFDRERDEDYLEEFGPGNWRRAECFKVEKALLTYGWGRWEETVALANFKRQLTTRDVEDVARVILLFSLQNYRGDEKIKTFTLDLITPPDQNQDNNMTTGRSSPTVRGRKGRKAKKTVAEELSSSDWVSSDQYNPELLLNDEQYRKHLVRHANKLLLRVKLLSYLATEIIGDLREDALRGVVARDIPLPPAAAEGEPPSLWWDEECDKCLLIGIFKHGYDRYNLIRQDTSLCFFHKCGPPDGAALLAEMQDDDLGKLEEDEEPETPATPSTPANDTTKTSVLVEGENTEPDQNCDSGEKLPFPSRADMNQRLRRIITAFQRHSKRQEIKLAQQARHQQRLEKLERFEAAIKEREMKKREQAQKKWSRREEADFYRVVSSYGVEYDRRTQQFDWNKFRTFSRLEKKVDETLTEYFRAFYAMCKRVTGRRLTDEEENLNISVDPISEERANRCLARIDLLSKIREEILPSPDLDERLKLCQPSIDLPEWWICGQHDKDLLIGAAKYGLNRLDLSVMHDPELSFKDIIRQAEAEAKRIEEALAQEAERKVESLAPVDEERKNTTIVEKDPIPIEINEKKPDKCDLDSASTTQTVNEADNVDKKSDEVLDEEKCVEEVKREPKADTTEDLVLKNEELQNDSDKSSAENAPKETEENGSDIAIMNGDGESHNEDESKSDGKVSKEEFGSQEEKEPQAENDTAPEAVEINGHTPEEKKTDEPADQSTKEKEELLKPSSEETPKAEIIQPVASVQPKPLRWPKDRVLQMRLEQIVYCIEKNEWPSIRHNFVSTLTGPLTSTPSVATADSSPRAVSPASLSSASREATPHPTPDHTPRRDTLSPLPDYLLDPLGDPLRRKRRRRRRYDPELEKAKLRNLLTQSTEQQFQQQLQQQQRAQQSRDSKSKFAVSQSLLNHASNFPPPNFFSQLPFALGNLSADFRNELLRDEKTASLLLGGLRSLQGQLREQQQQGQQQSLIRELSRETRHPNSSHAPPPPAHQSSSSSRRNPVDTLDLRFKANPVLAAPPAPAHKPTRRSPSPKSGRRTPASPLQSVLDLSSGQGVLPPKRSTRLSEELLSDSRELAPQPVSASSTCRPGKRIGSRLDAIALNLQAKKMMEEKPTESKKDFLSEIAQKSSEKRRPSSELAGLDLLEALQRKSQMRTPPAAHSSPSPSPSSSHKKPAIPSINDLLLGKLPEMGVKDPKAGQKGFESLMPYLSTKQGFQKWLEEHPDFLQQNPNLALQAMTALSGFPSMPSNIPANTELLELPEGRRRGRRPKSETMGHMEQSTSSQQPPPPPLSLGGLPPLNIDESVPVIDRATGKRLTGSEGPKLKHLAEWLKKHPTYDIDPQWMNPLLKDKAFSGFKIPPSATLPSQASPSSQSGIRTRTSDRSRGQVQEMSTRDSGQKRTTAASLLAQAQALQGPKSSASSSSTFGFPGSALNPSALAAFNPSLLAGIPGMKMFMEQMNAAVSSSPATSSSSTSKTTTTASSSTSTSSSNNPLNPFLSFPGLAGMAGLSNPFFPGFNLPGFPATLSALGGDAGRKSCKDPTASQEKASSSATSSIPTKAADKKGDKSKPSLPFSPSNPLASSLSFLGYPNANFLYPGLAGLSGLSGLPANPFASLAQGGLMNGLGGLTGLGVPSSKPKTSSASTSSSTPTTSSSKTSKNSPGAPSGLSLSTASSLLSSTGIHPSSAAAAAAMGDSDDESLKSLMGHEDDDDDDLNGDLDDIPDKDDSDSDYEARPKRKSAKNKSEVKSTRSSRSTASSSKSKN